jgi:hypothetical protein
MHDELADRATAGTKVSDETASHFVIGRTTYAEVVNALGQPNVVSSTANGRMAIYSYAQVSIRPITLVPVVGLFAGGADTTASGVSFTFDSRDILIGKGRTNMRGGSTV